MALEMAQLDCFRISSNNASACQQGAMNPGFGFADVVPLPTLHVLALVVAVHTPRDLHVCSICTKSSLNDIKPMVSLFRHQLQSLCKEGKHNAHMCSIT